MQNSHPDNGRLSVYGLQVLSHLNAKTQRRRDAKKIWLCVSASLRLCVISFACLALEVISATPDILDEQFELPAGFHIQRVATQEQSGGSYDLCFDSQGRLLVGDGNAVRRLKDEDIDGIYDGFEVIATGLGPRGPQGLLVWGDRLYAVGGDGLQLFEGYESGGPLVHRGRLGAKLNTGGDHDAHTIFRGPDDHIYLMAGNGSGIRDHLHITETNSPVMFEREASVFRISPDGKKWECIGSGGRNPPSLGMNYLGELFSFDSDMEWHVGLPWYRPVRLNHWVIGGDQGWQEVGAYPPYYIDCLPGILEVGRGSPNWGVFYEHYLFPAKYRGSFLVCDYRWKRESNDQYSTTGRLVAFFLKRAGAGWTATMETLARPKPNAREKNGKRIQFALVDIAVAPDGSLYVSDHNQGIWRISCESAGKAVERRLEPWEIRAKAAWWHGLRGEVRPLVELLGDKDSFVRRRAAESLARLPVSEAREPLINTLNDPERLVRYVAMCALAHHPLSEWLDQAVAKKHPQTQMRALVAGTIRRETIPEPKVQEVVRSLLTSKLSTEDELDLLRVIALFPKAAGADVERFLLAGFPDSDRNVRWEKVRLMGEFRVTKAFSLLLKELETERNHVTQFHIAKAIARLPRGWTGDEERRLLNWFLATQQGWFAQFAGKGVEFPAFWQTVLSDFAANHREAFMGASSKIDLASLMGTVFIDSLAVERLTALSEKETSPEIKKKILRALKRFPGAAVSEPAPVAKAAEKPDEEIHKFILAAKGGDATRGAKVYEALQCNSCHGGGVTPGREGRFFGPDLAGIAQRLTKAELADALVYPSKRVEDRFKGVEIEFADATPLTGFITAQDADAVTLADREQVHRIPRSKIRSINPQSSSLMPDKLLNRLSSDELRDLLAFLEDPNPASR
jgi:putative heme-binding domain-containing protein